MEEIYRKLTEYILEWNTKINLTAIRDPNVFYEKNIEDSLAISVCPQFEAASDIMDMGTGGRLSRSSSRGGISRKTFSPCGFGGEKTESRE